MKWICCFATFLAHARPTERRSGGRMLFFVAKQRDVIPVL